MHELSENSCWIAIKFCWFLEF